METTASEIFKRAVKGKNLMTPDIKGYTKLNEDSAVELSYGHSTLFGHSWGVSVVVNGKMSSADSEVFNTEEAATDYIRKLKDRYRK